MTEQHPRDTWLGTPDRFARQRRILSLDPQRDVEEVARLFYQDFGNVLLIQAVHSLLATFVNPRMSHLLAETGQLQHYTAKRILDTSLLTSIVIENGFGAGPGRAAGRRVNAMHRAYPIADEDFVFVGVDNGVQAIATATAFGWRAVTDHERVAVPLFFSRLARVFGARRALPTSGSAQRELWDHYLDHEASHDPVNAELAEAVLGWAEDIAPTGAGALLRDALVAHLDPRIARACGLPTASPEQRESAAAVLRAIGAGDPRPDGAPDGLRAMAAVIYPSGWVVDDLGHVPGSDGPDAGVRATT